MTRKAYLPVWIGAILMAGFFGDEILDWLVQRLDFAPSAVVAMLAWMPAGGFFVLLGLANLRSDNPFRGIWAWPLAASSLLAIVELLVVIDREPTSAAYDAAIATPAGHALAAGLIGAGALPPAAFVVVNTGHWIVQRLRGRKVRWKDNAEIANANPKQRRMYAIVLVVAAVFGLALAIASV